MPRRPSESKPTRLTERLSQRARELSSQVAHQVAGQVVGPGAQGLRTRAEELRAEAARRADERLEALIAERRAERGQSVPPEVDAALAQRRAEREARSARLAAREALLARAQTPHERTLLARLAAVTPWANAEGEGEGSARYTALLDGLAPGGDAAAEMAIHRALWGLAERRVLRVSEYGEVRLTLPEAGAVSAS